MLQLIYNAFIQLLTLLFVLSIVGLVWFLFALIGWIVNKDKNPREGMRMWWLGIVITAGVIGPFCYLWGNYDGYYEGLNDCGYELNGEGELVKKEDCDG